MHFIQFKSILGAYSCIHMYVKYTADMTAHSLIKLYFAHICKYSKISECV